MIHELVSIEKAARAIKCRRAQIRRLVEAGKLAAYKRGGSEAFPWLRVYLDEAIRAYEADSVYVPRVEKLVKPSVRRRPGRTSHPAFDCL